jgi:hypothetical protein
MRTDTKDLNVGPLSIVLAIVALSLAIASLFLT